MKKIFYTLIVLLLGVSQIIFAQKGTVAGKIIDKANGETLIGATIQLEKLNNPAEKLFTATDIDGNYSIKAEVGQYKIKISYISYENIEMEIVVKENEVTYVNEPMAEASSTLKEAVITATVMRSGTASLFIERKKASQVSDGVSADLIRKTPDRTTSDVLKRVTGASIQEGKFAIIRGMNDRYNAGYLDGALLPSTESDRKAFAFDVVPANLVDNLTIIKSGTADLVGDFGGGVIKINTKAVPDDFMQSFTIGAQTNSITTFNDFSQFKTYPGENFNILSDKRNIPNISESEMRIASTFASAEEKTKLAGISKGFNNDWTINKSNALPNTRFAYVAGFPIRLKNDSKIGVLLSATYADTRRASDGSVSSFDGAGQVSALKDKIFARNTSTGGIFNVNYVNQQTAINFRNLLNANTDNNTIERSGIGNISDDVRVMNFSNIVNYNRFYNSVLSLKQVFGDNFLTLTGAVNYSNIVRKTPDYRIVTYTKLPENDNFNIALGDFFNSSSGRFFSNLNETLLGANVEVAKHFDAEKVKSELKLGYFTQSRNRKFEGRSFVYNGALATSTLEPAKDLGTENIAANKLYLVEKTSNDLGYYQGKSMMNAYFASLDQTFGATLRSVIGMRYENSNLDVINQKLDTKIAEIKQNNWLPSINLCYYLSERSNLRADYFASLNRPEFRELAPFAFYVFDKNVEIKGNTDLKIASLNNFDLRYEFFPSGGELLSVGLFYKTIANPIEYGIDVTQVFTTFTLRNEKSARVYGVEMELKKKLNFINPAKIWNDLSVFSNFSLIRSQLQFDPGTQSLQDRPLQGQSPYVFNTGLQYDNLEKGWSASMVFNKIGRRIAYVGVDPKFGDTRQDIYEAPRSVLDVQIAKTYKKFNLKFTLGDVLRNNYTFYQDANQDGKFNSDATSTDRVMFKFNTGFTTNLSLGYTF
ncbi:MAG: TonB-dependent receptor domain-containing protein [Saprospiraceae bacterium]